jgi:hypothetical protein
MVRPTDFASRRKRGTDAKHGRNRIAALAQTGHPQKLEGRSITGSESGPNPRARFSTSAARNEGRPFSPPTLFRRPAPDGHPRSAQFEWLGASQVPAAMNIRAATRAASASHDPCPLPPNARWAQRQSEDRPDAELYQRPLNAESACNLPEGNLEGEQRVGVKRKLEKPIECIPCHLPPLGKRQFVDGGVRVGRRLRWLWQQQRGRRIRMVCQRWDRSLLW